MKEMIENVERMVVLWTLGNMGGIIFLLLILWGRIQITGYDKKKFIPSKKGLIIVYNHPSLWEPGLLPFLLYLYFNFLFSLKYIPYSTPDKTNYFDKWWFWPIRIFCIPIERETKKGRAKGLRRIIKNVNEGKIVMIAPEGGRTDKGEEFKILKEDGQIIIKKKSEILPEEKNLPKIRRFQRGFSTALKRTNAPVLFIGNKGGDEVIPNAGPFPKSLLSLLPNLKAKTLIKIGERLEIKDLNEAEDILLRLSQKQ